MLRRKADLSLWVVDCRRFAKVELSQLDGGVPGARSLGPGAERGRLPSGDEISSVSLESEVHSDIQTDSVESKSIVSLLATYLLEALAKFNIYIEACRYCDRIKCN